jgi:hypothetical protein
LRSGDDGVEGWLLTSVPRISVEAAADLGRAVSRAPDRQIDVKEVGVRQVGVKQVGGKYDGDIAHIIKQYPGCDDAYVLAFLRTRVHWFGRGTLIDGVLRPSLRTVHAAGRRLEIAGEIKIKAEPSQHRAALRFYPNNPLWPDTGAETTRR